MALWYINPSMIAAQETDSFSGDYGVGKLRDSWADVSWVAGDSWYQAAGTTFTGAVGLGAGGISASQRSTLGKYGTGPRPKLIGTGVTRTFTLGGSPARSFVTIQDLEIWGGTSGNDRRCIGAGSGANPCNDLWLRRLTLRDVPADNSTDCDAVFVEGNRLVVEDCEFFNIADDAIWNSGVDARIVRNKIHDVGLSGRVAGDCIQLVGVAGTAGAFYVADNECDHSRNPHKQGIIVSGASSGLGGLIERNNVIGPVNPSSYVGILVDQPGATVRANYVRSGTFGIMVQSNQTVIGNVVELASIGLIFEDVGAGSDNASVLNNTFLRTTDYAIYGNGSTGAGVVARNNIIANCAKGTSMKAGMTRSHNCFWGTAQIEDGAASAGTGNVLVDPQLREDFMPLALEVRSAASAVTHGRGDFYSKEFRGTIGAVQYQPQREVTLRRGVAA